MSSWEERVNAETVWICVLCWIPTCIELVAPSQTFSESLFAGQISFSSVMVDEAVLLEIMRPDILRTKSEFQIKISIICSCKLKRLCLFRMLVLDCLADVTSYLCASRIRLHFEPSSRFQSSPHGRVSNSHCEYLLSICFGVLKSACLVDQVLSLIHWTRLALKR